MERRGWIWQVELVTNLLCVVEKSQVMGTLVFFFFMESWLIVLNKIRNRGRELILWGGNSVFGIW